MLALSIPQRYFLFLVLCCFWLSSMQILFPPLIFHPFSNVLLFSILTGVASDSLFNTSAKCSFHRSCMSVSFTSIFPSLSLTTLIFFVILYSVPCYPLAAASSAIILFMFSLLSLLYSVSLPCSEFDIPLCSVLLSVLTLCCLPYSWSSFFRLSSWCCHHSSSLSPLSFFCPLHFQQLS